MNIYPQRLVLQKFNHRISKKISGFYFPFQYLLGNDGFERLKMTYSHNITVQTRGSESIEITSTMFWSQARKLKPSTSRMPGKRRTMKPQLPLELARSKLGCDLAKDVFLA